MLARASIYGSERRFSPHDGQISASRNEHGHVRYKAVGRLPETGTPWDNAILIPIESVWAVHDALPDAGMAAPRTSF